MADNVGCVLCHEILDADVLQGLRDNGPLVVLLVDAENEVLQPIR
jgi:hypothetical protein